MVSIDDVNDALREVIDPELGLDFVELGLIYDVSVEGGSVHVTYTLTSPGCPIGPQVAEQIEEFVSELEGVEDVQSDDDVLAAVDARADERGRQVRTRLLSRRRPPPTPAGRVREEDRRNNDRAGPIHRTRPIYIPPASVPLRGPRLHQPRLGRIGWGPGDAEVPRHRYKC